MNWKTFGIYTALFFPAALLALFFSHLLGGIYHQAGGKNEAIKFGISIFILIVIPNARNAGVGKKLSKI